MQVLQESGICQAMFNPNTQGPDDKCFMSGMMDLVLQYIPSSSFTPVVAILAWYAGSHINDVMMVARLGKAESQQQQTGVRVVSGAPSVPQAKSDPMQVTRT